MVPPHWEQPRVLWTHCCHRSWATVYVLRNQCAQFAVIAHLNKDIIRVEVATERTPLRSDVHFKCGTISAQTTVQ
jgi:hypothetical protein